MLTKMLQRGRSIMGFEILFGLLILGGIGFVMLVTGFLRKRNAANSDGNSKVTGDCGDTLELRLDFKNGKVYRSRPRSNGCGHSFNCIYSASELANGKSPEEILKITPEIIMKKVGDIPSDHINCAFLAASALHGAAKDYLSKQKPVR